jgi:hypothetical protein
MRCSLFANPPPQFLIGIALGLVLVAAIAIRRRPFQCWRELLTLCSFTLTLGPIVGAAMAGLLVVFGRVDSLDRWYMTFSFALVGLIASVIVTLTFAVIGAIRILHTRAPRDNEK